MPLYNLGEITIIMSYFFTQLAATHPVLEVIAGGVLFPPGEVRREDLEAAPPPPGLVLKSLQSLVQPRSHSHLRPLPGASLQLVSLTPEGGPMYYQEIIIMEQLTTHLSTCWVTSSSSRKSLTTSMSVKLLIGRYFTLSLTPSQSASVLCLWTQERLQLLTAQRGHLYLEGFSQPQHRAGLVGHIVRSGKNNKFLHQC